MVGVSPKAIIWVAVAGKIRYTKVTNKNSLWVIVSLRVRSIVELDSILKLPRGLRYPYSNQVHVCES